MRAINTVHVRPTLPLVCLHRSSALPLLQQGLFISEASVLHCSIMHLLASLVANGFSASRTLTPYVPLLIVKPSSASQVWSSQTRTVPQAVEGIQHGLSWAGLDYDFGTFSRNSLFPWLLAN